MGEELKELQQKREVLTKRGKNLKKEIDRWAWETGLDSRGRGLDAIMLYTYILVFVDRITTAKEITEDLMQITESTLGYLREFLLLLPAQRLLRGFFF